MTSAWRWPAGIITVLAATMALNGWVIWRASSDPTVTLEPDYYRKAVEWDMTQARARRGQRLGWVLRPALTAPAPGGAVLTVALTGPDGAAVAGARMRAVLRHVAYANDSLPVTLEADDAGHFRADVALRHPGLYDVELEAVRGTDRLHESRRLEAGRTTP